MPERPAVVALASLSADRITLEYDPVPLDAEPAEIATLMGANYSGTPIVLEIAGEPVRFRVKEREVSGPAPLGRTPWYRFVLVREP